MNSGGTYQTTTTMVTNGNAVGLESESLSVNLWLTVSSVLVLVSSTLAFYLLRRTRKVSYSAKFLSLSLLAFAILVLIVITARRFILHPVINLQLYLLELCLRHLSCTTLAIISLERYLCICQPFLYVKHVNRYRIKCTTFSCWGVFISLFYLQRFGLCSAIYDVIDVFTVSYVCQREATYLHVISYLLWAGISITSFIKIFIVLLTKRPTKDKGKAIPRATLFVFLNVVLFVIRIVLTGTLMYRFMSGTVGVAETRLFMDTMWLLSSFFFTIIYVMWFKECRYEFLKLLAKCIPRLADRVEKRRIEVYDIVVIDSKTKSSY